MPGGVATCSFVRFEARTIQTEKRPSTSRERSDSFCNGLAIRTIRTSTKKIALD